MKQGRMAPRGRHGASALVAASFCIALCLASSATAWGQTTGGYAPGRTTARPGRLRQPLNGPNVTNETDQAVSELVDSLFAPMAPSDPLPGAASKMLGVETSKATRRTQWSARLARNPNLDDGNPPFALIDRYGGVQRYVEPVPEVDLDHFIGQTVAVRRDTGGTLLATQLDLPRRAVRNRAASQGVALAALEEPLPPLEPTPAEGAAPSPVPAPSTMQGEPIEGEIIEGEGPYFDGQGESMMMSDGVDPLCLDSGAEFGGCTECGDAICGGRCRSCQGGCGLGSRPIFYARGEYLLWQFDGMQIPALVIRGVADNNGTPNDRSDDFITDAFVVYGDEEILNEERSGARVRLGYWLDDYGQTAIEGDYISMGEVNSTFVDGGDGTSPIVGRPFIDATTGLDAFQQVSFPGLEGTVTVDADSTFSAASLHIRRNLCCVPGVQTCCGDGVTCGSGVGCGSKAGCPFPIFGQCDKLFAGGTRHVDLLYGVRWARLQEGLRVVEDLEVIPSETPGFPDPPGIGTTFLLTDQFDTSNEFFGGDIGFQIDWERRRWSLELLSRLAIGNTRQRVNISGSNIATAPDGSVETKQGGLLTQDSNIGRYERDEFSVIPEIGITGGYLITDQLRFTLGYSLLYWSRVVRPGDQIDLEVNPGKIDFDPDPNDEVPARPSFAFRDTDIWAHGLNVGLDYRW